MHAGIKKQDGLLNVINGAKMLSLTIPGPVPSKKNMNKIIMIRGRRIVAQHAKFKRWHKIAKYSVDEQMEEVSTKKFLEAFKELMGNYPSILITFFWPDKRRRDLTNTAESVMDLLVDCNVIKDDCWAVVPKLTLLSGGVDRENPRAEVKIG